MFCFVFYNLVSVTIPASVITISKLAFAFSSNLQTLKFVQNSRLEKIEYGAFSECNLKRVNFPKSLKIIKSNAFGSNGLEKVTFQPDSQLEITDSQSSSICLFLHQSNGFSMLVVEWKI